VTSITLPDPQSSDMRHIQQMTSALPLTSARLSKQWISFLNYLLDGISCKNVIVFHLSLFFWFHIHWFYPYCSFEHSKRWRHKLGHTKYLVQTYIILVLILYSKLIKNLASLAVLIRFNNDSWYAYNYNNLFYFLGPTCILPENVAWHCVLLWRICWKHESENGDF